MKNQVFVFLHMCCFLGQAPIQRQMEYNNVYKNVMRGDCYVMYVKEDIPLNAPINHVLVETDFYPKGVYLCYKNNNGRVTYEEYKKEKHYNPPQEVLAVPAKTEYVFPTQTSFTPVKEEKCYT